MKITIRNNPFRWTDDPHIYCTSCGYPFDLDEENLTFYTIDEADFEADVFCSKTCALMSLETERL